MNSKGFTLVELLAVLIILSVIMGIAIPSITSSMERTKKKQNEQKYKLLESYAEIYVSDHKNAVYDKMDDLSKDFCYITLDMLSDYLTDDSLNDADGNEISGYIKFTKPNQYEFVEGAANNYLCG